MAAWVKRIAAVALGCLAAAFFLFGIALAFASFDTSRAGLEEKVLRDFRKTERFTLTYKERTSHLPDDSDIVAWAKGAHLEYAYPNLLGIRSAPVDFCDEDEKDRFQSAPNDRFVLTLWRSEWLDCYASPSGKHTLLLGKDAWLKFNLKTGGPVSLGALAASLVFGWSAVRLRRRRKLESN